MSHLRWKVWLGVQSLVYILPFFRFRFSGVGFCSCTAYCRYEKVKISLPVHVVSLKMNKGKHCNSEFGIWYFICKMLTYANMLYNMQPMH